MNPFSRFGLSLLFMAGVAAAQGTYELSNGETVEVAEDGTWSSSSGFAGTWTSNGLNIDLGNDMVLVGARDCGVNEAGSILGGGGGTWCRSA